MEGDSGDEPDGGGSPLGLIGAGVIALAVVGAGAYWLFGRQAEPAPEADAVSEPPADEPPAREPEPSTVEEAAPSPVEPTEPEVKAPPPAEAAGPVKGKVLVIDEKEGPKLIPMDALTSLPNSQEPPPVDRAALRAAANQNLSDPLSDRELEVLELIGRGYTNAEIARRLFISKNTVKTHITNVYGKLEVEGRDEAIERARELGLID